MAVEKILGFVLAGLSLAGLYLWYREAREQGRAQANSVLGPPRTIHIRYGPARSRGTVEGVVLQRRIIHSGESGVPDRYYVAVDDGRSERVYGLPVTPQQYQQVVEGDRVTARISAWSRRVRRLEAVNRAAPANPAFAVEDSHLAVPARFAVSALEAPVEVTALPPLSDEGGVIEGVLGYVYAPVGTRIYGTGTVGDYLQIYEAATVSAAERMVRVLAADAASKPLPPSQLEAWKRGPWKHALLHVRPHREGALAFKLYRRNVNSVFDGAKRLNAALRKRRD